MPGREELAEGREGASGSCRGEPRRFGRIPEASSRFCHASMSALQACWLPGTGESRLTVGLMCPLCSAPRVLPTRTEPSWGMVRKCSSFMQSRCIGTACIDAQAGRGWAMASLGGSGTELRHLTGRRTGLVLARSCCSTAEMGACFLTCRTRGVESAPAGSSRRGRRGRGTSSECCVLAWQASCAAEPLEEGRCSGWALEGVKQEDEDACEGGSKVRMLEL